MNRTDLEEMRRRLAARAATDDTDTPLSVGIGAALLAVLVVIINFI